MRLHNPMATKNSRITEPEAKALEGCLLFGCQAREQNASSSSGRNESRDPDVLASGDRFQSKEDDHMTNRLSPEVELLPNLDTRNEEHVKKLFWRN